MGKTKNPELENEQIVEDEPILVKGPLRDDPEPEYVPAWEVVNDRQNILTDKLPPKIYSIDALVAAGVVNEENLATYLSDNGYVKNTDYATASTGGVVKVSGTYGAYVSGAGIIYPAARTAAQYEGDSTTFFISKGTLENIKEDVTARALVGIAEAQVTPTVTGYYNVQLHYDADLGAWGVIISPAT